MSHSTRRLARVALVLGLAAGCDDAEDDLPAVAAGRGGELGAGAVAGSERGEVAGEGGRADDGEGGTGGETPAGSAGAAGSAGTPASAGGEAGETSGAGGGAGAGQGGDSGAGAAGAHEPDALLFDVNVVRASDVNPDAPGTVGIVTFSADIPGMVEARVEFGLDRSYGMVAPVDLAEPEFRTLLLGMKPSRTYHFRVVARDATQSYASADYTLLTGPKPESVSIDAFTVLDESARERGFIVGSYWAGVGATVPFIIDPDGEIVWWRLGMNGAIARARMSAGARNLWFALSTNAGAPLRRTGMDGIELELYANAIASHDITPVTGEIMAYLEYGESDCDSIYEIDPSGATREVFESEGVVTRGEGTIKCHGNALRYSAAEDLYTFSEWRESIFAVTRAGEVAFRFADRVNGGGAAWGGTQHGHHLLADSLLIFANGLTARASQAIEYALDGSELRRFPSGGFSANLGDVQRLPRGNTLITYSNAALVEEVNAAGEPVLRIEGSARFGYLSWRESLYGPTPDTDD